MSACEVPAVVSRFDTLPPLPPSRAGRRAKVEVEEWQRSDDADALYRAAAAALGLVDALGHVHAEVRGAHAGAPQSSAARHVTGKVRAIRIVLLGVC